MILAHFQNKTNISDYVTFVEVEEFPKANTLEIGTEENTMAGSNTNTIKELKNIKKAKININTNTFFREYYATYLYYAQFYTAVNIGETVSKRIK